MSDTEKPADRNLPPPDIRGRRLDHPASQPLKMELLELTVDKPLEVLIPNNDLEAANFAAMTREFMRMNGRECTVIPVHFGHPFQGLRTHVGDDKVQFVIGHR